MPILQIEITSDQQESLDLAWAAVGGLSTRYESKGLAASGECARLFFNPLMSGFPPTAIATLQAAVQSAAAALQAALVPPVAGGLSFVVENAAGASIPYGTTGVWTLDVTFIDPSYSDTVTLSVDYRGNTSGFVPFTFSPASVTGTTTGITLTMPATTAPIGAYLFTLIGTDSTGLTNSVNILVNIV